MATPEQDFQDLGRKLAELRREMESENAAFNAVHDRILEIRRRCDALARDIEHCLRRAAESKAPEAVAPPEPSPYAAAVERVRAVRGEVEKEGLEELEEIGAAREPAVEKPVRAEEPVAAAPAREAFELFAKAPTEEGMEDALLGSISRLTSRMETVAAPEPQAPPPPGPTGVRNLETIIGSYWFARLGAISLLVGFVFLAAYIQPHLTPTIRVCLSYLAAAVLCAIGFWAERAYPKFSRPVLAAGLVLAFFTSFAGHFIRPMECFSLTVSTALMLVTAAAVVGAGAALRSQALGALALAMGFWVAVFSTRVGDAFTPLMIAFLSVVGVGMFVILRWATVEMLAVVGAYLCLVWWMLCGKARWEGETLFWVEFEFLTVYFAAFLAGDLIGRWRSPGKTLESVWERTLAADQCVLAVRFLNPIVYFLLGSYVFWDTRVFWDTIHYFYWPLGAVLVAIGVAGRRIEREATNEEDIFYVMASGLITLGCASAFGAMKLSNVLALEGLCLFAIRRITGRPIFQHLSALHFVLAFLQFNFSAFVKPGGTPTIALLTPVAVSDWKAFATGLPAMLFMIAPTFLEPLWGKRRREATAPDAPGPLALGILPELDERSVAHARTLAASVLLLRLFHETVRCDVAFGLWVLLVPAVATVAWRWGRAPALWTLGGSLLAWAHLYFFPQLDRVAVGDPAWMFPAALGLTLLTLRAGVAVETMTKGRIYEWREEDRAADSGWVVLTVLLVLLSVVDLGALIEKRAALSHQYPWAGALSVALIVTALVSRLAFPGLVGLFLIVTSSVLTAMAFAEVREAALAALFLWTAVGTALAILFAQGFDAWGPTFLRRAFHGFRYGMDAVVLLTATVLAGLIFVTLRFGRQYEEMGWVAVAATTLGVLALGLLVEKLAGGEGSDSVEEKPQRKTVWGVLTAVLTLLVVVHVIQLVGQRAAAIHRYAYVGAFAIGLLGLVYLTRMAFPCVAGCYLLAANSLLLLVAMAGPKWARLEGFFAWTLAGAALAVCFERGFRAWGERLLPHRIERLRLGSAALVALVTLVLLGLTHYTPWIGGRYETVGVTLTAAALLGLGVAFRSAGYRRFGLAVFLYALGRVYLLDLRGLETFYRIIAFMVLGAVLIAVSYLYTRFKEQFQKWV
jgi:hypothetical protein